MRFVGLLGILVLLGIAYLMSNNRRRIQPRIVIWGVLLQLLFAAIILGSPGLSFAAMGIFLLLLLGYVFKDDLRVSQSGGVRYLSAGMILLGTAVSLLLFYGIAQLGFLGWLWFGIVAALILLAVFKKARYQRFLSAGILVAGFTWLVHHRYTGEKVFAFLSGKVERFLKLSDYGAEFLFGNLALSKYFFPDTGSWPGFGYQFAFSVLPVIIFFACFMSILYHMGVMQAVVKVMARFMQWTMGTSGAETLSCSANIFVGQTEAPFLVRPFLDKMTMSELLTIMVGGFATIAGGVLAGYIRMGISAGHLIAASVMSAPAALVVAKIIYPETEHSQTAGDVEVPEGTVKHSNLLDAASHGVTDGLKLAANVGAMLIAFIAVIGLIDSLLSIGDRLIDGKLLHGSYQQYAVVSNMSPIHGEYQGFFPGSLKTLFGTILRPLAWVMGVSWKYAGEVGNLLGVKLTLTEFVAYGNLAELIRLDALSEKAAVISTYALCGFANFASIGIQLGGIGALAPKRRSDLSKVAMKAMFGGAIASWMTATIAGMLL